MLDRNRRNNHFWPWEWGVVFPSGMKFIMLLTGDEQIPTSGGIQYSVYFNVTVLESALNPTRNNYLLKRKI